MNWIPTHRDVSENKLRYFFVWSESELCRLRVKDVEAHNQNFLYMKSESSICVQNFKGVHQKI